MQIGDLFATLSLQYSDFSSGLKNATREAYKAGKEMGKALGSESSKGISEAASAAKDASSSFSQMGRNLKNVVSGIIMAQTFYRVANAIQDATASLFEFNNNIEEANIAFKYLLGNAGAGRAFVTMLQDFAATTPFTYESAEKGSRQLLSMGFAASEVLPIMRTLSDATVVAGGSADQFERIVYALGKIKTSNKVMTRDLMQFANAGVPVFQILREELGLSDEELKNVAKSGVSADQAIQAILAGLEKRYKGASEEISNTTRGLLNQVSDNFLIIGGDMVRGLSNRFKDVLRTLNDGMSRAREIVQTFGFGGLIDTIFPPGMQTQIRAFFAYIGGAFRSIGQLIAALSPIVREFFFAFVNVFNAAAPLIIGVVQALTALLRMVTQNTGAIRLLAFTLTGLFIASKVATAVTFLTKAVKGLGIAGIVSQFVTMLGKAIGFLTTMMMKNPVIAVISVLTMALLALAMSTQTAKRWVDSLTKSIAQLLGINIDSVWEPVDPSEAASDLEDFYKALEDTAGAVEDVGEGIEDSGKGADKAKKKNEKWLASFDEVFPVKEALDDMADAAGGAGDAMGDLGSGLGNVPKLPDFKPPNLPDVKPLEMKPIVIPPPTLPPLTPITKWQGDFNEIMDALRKKAMEPIRVPAIQIPDFAPQIDKVREKLGQLRSDVIDGFESMLERGRSISADFGSVLDGVMADVSAYMQLPGEWALQVGESISVHFDAFREKAAEFGGNISADLAPAGQAIAAFANDVATQMGQALDGVKNFGIGGAAALLAFIGTSELMKKWGSDSTGAVESFAAQAATSLGMFVATGQGLIRDFVNNTINDMMGWATDNTTQVDGFTGAAETAIAGFTANSEEQFRQWTANTAQQIVDWNTAMTGNFQLWSDTTKQNITDWSTNTQENFTMWKDLTGQTFTEWFEGSAGGFQAWGETSGGNIASWATSAMGNVAMFVTNSSGNFQKWIQGTGKSITEWGNVTGQNFATWSGNAQQAIIDFASGAWGNFDSFLVSSSQAVKNWANNLLENIFEMARSAAETLGDLAKSLGGSAVSFVSSGAKKVGGALSSAGEWASKNKNILIPVALGLGAIAGVGAIIATGGTAAAPILGGLGALAGFETGGIIDQDSIVRVGEKGRREAIVPLDNATYMAPFADAIASRIGAYVGNGGYQEQQDLRPLYVGTLIANEQGLQELNRQLKIIDEDEMRRRGQL